MLAQSTERRTEVRRPREQTSGFSFFQNAFGEFMLHSSDTSLSNHGSSHRDEFDIEPSSVGKHSPSGIPRVATISIHVQNATASVKGPVEFIC